MQTMTYAYLRALLTSSGERVPEAPRIGYKALRGVDPTESYARPFQAVWWRLSNGLAYKAAVVVGRERLIAIAKTDLQLSRTHSARHSLSKAKVRGYRRVLNGDTCELCVQASKRIYSTGDLMPIHPGCNCSVEPILGADPRSLNEGIGPKPVETEVQDHGELGPVLTKSGEHFKSE